MASLPQTVSPLSDGFGVSGTMSPLIVAALRARNGSTVGRAAPGPAARTTWRILPAARRVDRRTAGGPHGRRRGAAGARLRERLARACDLLRSVDAVLPCTMGAPWTRHSHSSSPTAT